MKTKIKRHSRSVISVVLAVCMLISCMTVGLIATDAAKVGSESVGWISTYYVTGTFNSWGDGEFSNNKYTVTLDANTDYEFKIKTSSTWYGTGSTDTISSSTDYTVAVGNENNVKFKTTSAGVYTFTLKSESSDPATVTIRLDYPSNTTTWTVAGSSAVFGSNWSATDTNNDMTSSDGTTYTLTKNSVSLTAGENYEFKVAKNHAWDEAYPSSNETFSVSESGVYDVTVTFNSSTKTVTVTTTLVTSDFYVYGQGFSTSSNVWDWNNDLTKIKKMTAGATSGQYYLEHTVAANDEFGIYGLTGGTGTHYRASGSGNYALAADGTSHSYAIGWENPTFLLSNFTAGDNVKIWIDVNDSAKCVWVEKEPDVLSTLSVASSFTDATVTAYYDGNEIAQGQHLDNVPAGATITVNVTPTLPGKKPTLISTTPTVTPTQSGRNFTFAMPAQNTSIDSVTLGNVTKKKVYFNNYYTRYSMVHAYAWYGTSDQSTIDEEPLGSWNGAVMTRIANTNTWEVEVPEDCPYIIFIGDNGYNTKNADATHITIPWSDPDLNPPMYTAGKDAANPSTDGTWGKYKERDNETVVSDGDTMTDNSDLFTGLTATMYDYYVDSEYEKGWLQIDDPQYSKSKANFTKNPYTYFNDALDAYAREFGVTYPLYFGDFFDAKDDGNSDITKVQHEGTTTDYKGQVYQNWNKLINNSSGLNDTEKKNAVTGLSGKTLSGSNIHYYKSGDANENGAEMAMFDEDFLSGQNIFDTKLAQILRCSSFPVRKTSKDTYTHVYFDATAINSWYGNASNSIYAYFWNGSTSNKKVAGTKTGDIFAFEIPSGYENGNVLFYRANGINGTWNDKTDDLTVPKDGDSEVMFKATGGSNKKINGDWATYASAAKNSHVYYEYDSTDGKDNAFITDISSDKKTAKINYYDQSKNNIVYAATSEHTGNGKAGFFPFDFNSFNNQKGTTAHDLGFGMKIEIPFTLEKNGQFDDGTPQVFEFSGDDDLWVFVDGKLVLDLGGDHNATQGVINFADKTATATSSQAIAGTRNGSFDFDNSNPNTVHTMTLYYMERGMWDSNLKFGFSFHAIPNQLKTEKKVRTANINAGFYKLNSTTESGVYVDNGEREVTKFEATYQDEEFVITHEYHKPGDSFVTAAGKKYTIGSSATQTVNADGQYTLKNDEIAYFLQMFDKNDTIRVKESANTSNLYNYDMSVKVYDDANNGAEVSGSGTAESGYEFVFAPTSTATTTIDNLNLRARFTNQMRSHNLTLTKTVVGEADNTTFKFRIKFKFGNYDYTAYPLNCYVTTPGSVTKVNTSLTDAGEITISNGQTITLEKIPENALVQIEEVEVASAYNYNGVTLTGASATNINNGVQFAVGTSDVNAEITNSKFTGFTVSKELKYSKKDGEAYVDYPDSTSEFRIKVEQSTDGTTWSALANKTFTSSDTSRTGTLQTAANGITTIKRGEKLSFSEIPSNTYIRVTEDTETSYNASTGAKTGDHMPLDYQYAGAVAVQGTEDPTAYNNKVDVDNFKGCQFELTAGRVDVTITNMKPRYEYIANYEFTSRKKNVTKTTNESIFGELNYTAKDVFTAQELYDYTQFAMKKNYQQIWQKGIEFKDDKLKEAFFTKKTAPFDDNFRQEVSWKIKDAQVEYHFGSADTACQLVINPSATLDDAQKLNVNFYLPCAMITDETLSELVIDTTKLHDGVPMAKMDDNGRPVVNSENYYTYLPKNGIKFADWYASNGASLHSDPENPKFVTAPKVVYDVVKGTNKYFQYWSIKTMENDSENSVEYAKCYSNEMNYVFFKDSEVVAVYGDNQATGYENARTLEGNAANVVFLENSRNQWNQTATGATVYGNNNKYGDRIFSDFVIDFHYVNKDNENVLLQTIPEAERGNYKVGLLIETVRDLDATEVDKDKQKMLKTDKQIADSFRAKDNMEAQNAAMDALIAKYKNSTALDSKYLNSEISVAKLDNKNELEYAYSFANISQTKDYRTETTRKDKLYRAYAYLIHIGGGEKDANDNATDVKIISDPVYFTIYNMASIVNDYDVKVTKKQS